MKLSRRALMLGAAGAVGGGSAIGAVAVRQGAIAEFVLEVVAKSFGPQFAAEPAAREFADVYEAFVDGRGGLGLTVHALYGLELDRIEPIKRRLMPQWRSIVQKFAMSTNVVLAHETGAPLAFMGLYAPYHSPCSNQLSALAVS